MDSDELKELQIPELGLSFGASISVFKQSWAAFKLNRDRDEPARVQYYPDTINRIQEALGIEVTEFQL